MEQFQPQLFAELIAKASTKYQHTNRRQILKTYNHVRKPLLVSYLPTLAVPHACRSFAGYERPG